ncbi:hypothetical protein CTAYLR_007999 [Chrysophaeum taylorii]|uniref:Uncharacterized protein n=1 Tax=Chrysophaeum taylorii TaxID=2483200 RepID=A0AAD7U6Y6_9STRA|nr:hypothetical protein CTAYLR_007999 [Chrysophaeum taylorii]
MVCVALALVGGALAFQAPVRTPARRSVVSMRLGGGRSGSGSSKGCWSSRIRGKLFWGGKKPPQPPSGNGGGGIVSRRATAAGDEEPEEEEEKQGMWAAYEKALEENPLLIKGLTSFVGFTLGDILAQLFIEKKGPYDPVRTARLASFGFLVHGTTSHWFYGVLDGKIPGTTAGAVASKVAIDQILWNPIFGVMFFGYMGILEGSGIEGTILKIKRDLITQVTGSWTVWPLAHAINFKFVPNQQRVLYINTIQIFYNCFLSIVGNRKPPVPVAAAADLTLASADQDDLHIKFVEDADPVVEDGEDSDAAPEEAEVEDEEQEAPASSD